MTNFDQPAPTESQPIKFDFRGNAREWFGIWIVNLLLSIVTIGIYSAWAKVRRMKYFRNHTFIGDRNFDYHATGMQILIGRIIVVVAYIAFNVAVQLSPIVAGIMAVLFIIALPFLLVRSLRFNARMTSFSNIRFDFTGGAGKAFVVYFLYPTLIYLGFAAIAFLTLVTAQTSGGILAVIVGIVGSIAGLALAVLAIPLIDRAVKNFTIDNHRLGTSEFDFNVALKPFVVAMLLAIAWVIVVSVIATIVLGVSLAGLFFTLQNAEQNPTAMFAFIGLLYAILLIGFLPAAFIYQAFTRNAIYNSVTLGGVHRFHSDISALKLFWIAFSNMIVVIFTLGLMLPWAQIRLSNYLAEHTYAIPQGGLDGFVGQQIEEGSAVGDAFTDLESFDVGLPI